MFSHLKAAPSDPILALSSAYREDERAEKIDLGVGVFKNIEGQTPIMRAVKLAEKHLYEAQESKSYVGMRGDQDFNQLMAQLVLGTDLATRASGVQAVGGSGALLLLARLIRRAQESPKAQEGIKVWVSDPTWANHIPILDSSGLVVKTYPYFDASSASLRFEAMIDCLNTLGPQDVVLLHGCCHNPTGVNLSQEQWDILAELAAKRGFVPFFDLAYHGFGESLEIDSYGIRTVARKVSEVLLAVSCSKNFGLYRDRVGTALVITQDKAQSEVLASQLAVIARQLYSMPPDHGAALVRIILGNEALRADWEAELTAMRAQMNGSRERLADLLRQFTNSDRFDFIARHRGMFSMLGLSSEACDRLKQERGIYMVRSSRINIAGVTPANVEALARAIAEVESVSS